MQKGSLVWFGKEMQRGYTVGVGGGNRVGKGGME